MGEDLKIIKKSGGNINLFDLNPLITVTKADLIQSVDFDDYIDLSIESANPIELNIGDKMVVKGMDYFLNLQPQVSKLNSRKFVYNLRFEGVAYLLRKIKMFNLDSEGIRTSPDFAFTGKIGDHLNLLKINANKNVDMWTIGTSLATNIVKTIVYNNDNLLVSLHKICEEFKTEFKVDYHNWKYRIRIGTLGANLDYTFEYGRDNGLYDLSRTRTNDEEVVTRLYAYGSNQNLPIGYRGFSERLQMPIKDYIENSSSVSLFGYVEDVYLSDVAPRFNGTISNVGELEEGVQEVTVNAMDFDLKEVNEDGNTKYLIAGTDAQFAVNSGNLAGYSFDIIDYNHATKTFKLRQFSDERDVLFPSEPAFIFKVGDAVTLLDIIMPEAYITDAEERLQDEAQKVYDTLSTNNVKYKLNVDPLYMRDKSISIGDYVTIKDLDIKVDKSSRIINLTYDLISDIYNFDIADLSDSSFTQGIVNSLQKASDKSFIQNEKIDKGSQSLERFKDRIVDDNFEIRGNVINNEIIQNIITADVIKDDVIAEDKTWSSEKINQELNSKQYSITTGGGLEIDDALLKLRLRTEDLRIDENDELAVQLTAWSPLTFYRNKKIERQGATEES